MTASAVSCDVYIHVPGAPSPFPPTPIMLKPTLCLLPIQDCLSHRGDKIRGAAIMINYVKITTVFLEIFRLAKFSVLASPPLLPPCRAKPKRLELLETGKQLLLVGLSYT